MRSRYRVGQAVLLAFLTAALAVPPDSLRASAQQQGAQQPPADQKKPPQYSISVESPLVNVDAVVTDQDGNILTGLRKDNFRIYADGELQQISNFAPTDAPITVVMLMEFSKLGYEIFAYTAKYWSQGFLNQLKKDDWVAVKTFDMKTHLELDFTQDKMEARQAISRLYFPGFSEANLFDALIETMDQLKDVKGKKAILILSSGLDTFSRHTLTQALAEVKQSDVTIFSVGVSQQLVEYMDSHQMLGAVGRMDFLQGQNQLTAFARMTGGYAWFPQFDGQLPGIFSTVAAFLRNQYTLGFIPTNQANDGKFHKIKVEIVDDSGQPYFFTNAKGKKRKIVVYAREGYTAPKGSVGD